MAELRNDSGALRLALALVARDGPDRLLCTAGLEYLDQRDGEWWPLVRLPPIHLAVGAVERLLEGQASFLRGAAQGYAWTPGEAGTIAIHLGAAPGGALLEVGVDLGDLLADAGGVPPRAGAELALFRFRATQRDLVRFSDALAGELGALGP
jgi:hypothetical protein